MSVTAAQLALLRQHQHEAKVALDIPWPTQDTQYFCSGEDAVTVGSNLYLPRAIEADKLSLANPSKARATIDIDDADHAIKSMVLSGVETCSGLETTVYFLLRQPGQNTWTTVAQVDWIIHSTEGKPDGWLALNLFAASGTRPRAGLLVGNRSEFEYAPEAGETFIIGNSAAGVGAPGETCVHYTDPDGRHIRWCF
jgi:hypothetical protein